MHTEDFEIEFQVPVEEERYITFELWVYGGWQMLEVDGGEMREALVLEEEDFEEHKFSIDDRVFIKNWIDANRDAIRKMFTERIKKYQD